MIFCRVEVHRESAGVKKACEFSCCVGQHLLQINHFRHVPHGNSWDWHHNYCGWARFVCIILGRYGATLVTNHARPNP